VGLLGLAVLWTVFSLFVASKAAVPDLESSLHVPGLNAPVQLLREASGMVHINASCLDDAMLAQGFVHAQMRMWQLEFQRRVGAGRLSEVVGSGGLGPDKLMRVLGMYTAAQRAYTELSPSTRALRECVGASRRV
jgi:penicillin amidase